MLWPPTGSALYRLHDLGAVGFDQQRARSIGKQTATPFLSSLSVECVPDSFQARSNASTSDSVAGPNLERA